MEVYCVDDYPAPLDNLELQISTWTGLVKSAMVEHYGHHVGINEHIKIMKKPELRVLVTKTFAPGKLTIAPLSRNLQTYAASFKNLQRNAGGAFVVDHDFGKTVVRKDLVWPDVTGRSGTAVAVTVPNLVPYWAARRSSVRSQVNCERRPTTVQCKVGKTSYAVELHAFVNTVEIKEGSEVVFPKDVESEDEEPEPKRARIDEPKGGKDKSGKGGGQGKAAGAGKGAKKKGRGK